MMVEVKGIGIPNKGAELMLVAIFQAFEQAGIRADFVSDAAYTPYIARARYGLYQKGELKFKGRDFSFLVSLLPSRLLERFGLVRPDDIDVILDASGFAYGDQWGVTKLKHRLSSDIAALKRKGKMVILLPQAFGPFKSAGFNDEMAKVLDLADRVFVRDQVSKEYLDRIRPGKSILMPDFTNLVKPEIDPEQRDVCIIPNNKMISKGGDKTYKDDLVRLAKDLMKQGRNVSILVHEGVKDREIAEYVAEQAGGGLEILSSDDPVKIKSMIGSFSIVVSSRFHGLVSALSQDVPAVATGWSHKYRELMADYGVEELMVPEGSGYEELWEKVQVLLSVERHAELAAKIGSKSAGLKAQSEAMWQDVFSLLDSES